MCLSFSKTALRLIMPVTQSICYSGRCLSSSGLSCGRSMAWTCTPLTIRAGESCSNECIKVMSTMLMSWSSASLMSNTVCSGTLLSQSSTSVEVTERVRACSGTTVWTLTMSLSDTNFDLKNLTVHTMLFHFVHLLQNKRLLRAKFMNLCFVISSVVVIQ